MQMAECHRNLESVEFTPCFRETLHFSELSEKLTSSNKAHYEKELSWRLKNIIESYQKWMLAFFEYLFFKQSWLKLIKFQNHVFTNRFHRKNFLLNFELYKKYLPKATLTNDSFKYKIGKLHLTFISNVNCIRFFPYHIRSKIPDLFAKFESYINWIVFFKLINFVTFRVIVLLDFKFIRRHKIVALNDNFLGC